MKTYIATLTAVLFASPFSLRLGKLDSQEGWKKNIQSSKGIIIEGGLVSPKEKTGHFKTKLKKFKKKKAIAINILINLLTWQNWKEIPGVGPSNWEMLQSF